jgi:hypothetical protein
MGYLLALALSKAGRVGSVYRWIDGTEQIVYVDDLL